MVERELFVGLKFSSCPKKPRGLLSNKLKMDPKTGGTSFFGGPPFRVPCRFAGEQVQFGRTRAWLVHRIQAHAETTHRGRARSSRFRHLLHRHHRTGVVLLRTCRCWLLGRVNVPRGSQCHLGCIVFNLLHARYGESSCLGRGFKQFPKETELRELNVKQAR